MSRIELIRYDLENGERDLPDGDVGFRVCDLKCDFWIRVKDLKMRFRVRVKDLISPKCRCPEILTTKQNSFKIAKFRSKLLQNCNKSPPEFRKTYAKILRTLAEKRILGIVERPVGVPV